MIRFRATLACFTRIPVGTLPLEAYHNALGRLPLAGLLIGASVGVVAWLSTFVLPSLLCGVLACLAWIWITGGLHLDGVADCGDGLFVAASPERRLEIMKDSCLGTFGGISLFSILALKTSALAALCASLSATGDGGEQVVSSLFLFLACITAAVISRSCIFIAMRMPSARPNGMGNSMVAGVTPHDNGVAVLLCLILSIISGWAGLIAVPLAGAITALILYTAKQRINGVTGDVFGCLIESVECAVLIAFCSIL